jgi:hypothetical protein
MKAKKQKKMIFVEFADYTHTHIHERIIYDTYGDEKRDKRKQVIFSTHPPLYNMHYITKI